MSRDAAHPPVDLRLVYDRQVAERRTIRAELAALAARAREADLLSIALVLDLALTVDLGDGAPWEGGGRG